MRAVTAAQGATAAQIVHRSHCPSLRRPLGVLRSEPVTLHSVLAAYGLENVRPYRVGAGRNNEHWYVGTGLVLRRYGSSRSDAAIGYEHAILGQLREQGWPVAVPIPSDTGRLVVAGDGRRYSLFPRLAGRRGNPARPRQPRELGQLLGRLHRDLAAVPVAGPPDTFPRILEMPADPAWQRLDALDDPVLTGLIRRKLAEVRAAAGSTASSQLDVQLVHGDWHDGNVLYQGGTVSGVLDFDFVHSDLPLVDVAIATLIPGVEDSAQIAAGYFGVRPPAEHELDLIATAQQARGLGHVAFFTDRHADGDHGALDQIRLGVDLLLRAEQRWPPLRAAILNAAG
jgi:Ser/Thr protein kinase RdoA (MazF antagonist)